MLLKGIAKIMLGGISCLLCNLIHLHIGIL